MSITRNVHTAIAELVQSARDELQTTRALFHNPKLWLILGIDIVLLLIALYLSYFLRYEGGTVAHGSFVTYLKYFPLILIIKIPVFYFFGLYKGMWRYTSTQDLKNIIKANTISFCIILVSLVYINRLGGLSRSVFILDGIISFLFICGNRLSIRFYYGERNGTALDNRLPSRGIGSKKKKKLLVIGAGDAAEKVLREILGNPLLEYTPVGLIDDRRDKIGLKIHGVPILGNTDDLAEHVIRTEADEILIAIANARRDEMSRLHDLCQRANLPFKVIPSLSEIIDEKVSIKNIRDFSIKDLLGREEIVLEQEKIGEYIRNKKILITGAGGSIGSELCRQILRFSPGELILYDSCEENLYDVEMELIHQYNFNNIVSILGRVQDIRLLNKVFNDHEPQSVFHAAAYKHVPLIEKNPWEAIHNNIIASQLLLEASILYQVESFVLVSTDKAVRPSSVMGASKRLTELLMFFYARSNWDGEFSDEWERLDTIKQRMAYLRERRSYHDTRFIAVRFGNVLGSSGSVIPLFRSQIERGGPVTVTHPDINRYFMSIEEAAQLILQAGAMGGDGEIFILKMGEPVKVDHMAREMIRLAGKEPDIDIPIIYTGLRPGEKLYEELITDGEGIAETNHEKILVLRNDKNIPLDRNTLITQLKEYAANHQTPEIIDHLKRIIPEYVPDNRYH